VTDAELAVIAATIRISANDGIGVISGDLSVLPSAVIDAAKTFVSNWYADAKAEVSTFDEVNRYNTDNWRIDDLEQVYYYAESGIVLYRVNWAVHVTDPENVMLVGGMSISGDNWLTDHYPNAYYLVFEDRSGTMSDLRYVTSMFSNDSYPGESIFNEDLNRRLRSYGLAADDTDDNASDLAQTFAPVYEPNQNMNVKLEIEATPDDYTLLMSSVPGIYLHIKGETSGEAKVTYTADTGTFGLLENREIIMLGNPAERRFGSLPSVHWIPDNTTKDGDTVTVKLVGGSGEATVVLSVSATQKDGASYFSVK